VELTSNYEIMEKSFIILTISLLFTLEATALPYEKEDKVLYDKHDYVLLLNFYRTTNEWANGIDGNIIKYLDYNKKKIYLKNMSEAASKKNRGRTDWWKSFLGDIPQKKPKIVIILGDAGWILYRQYMPQEWRKIPCIVIPARNRVLPFNAFIDSTDVADNSQIPFSKTIKGAKVLGLSYVYYAKETIQLLKKLQPGMKQFMFISDRCLASTFAKYDMLKNAERYFPKLKFISFERDKHTTRQLLDTLQRLDNKTGIIFYGWSGCDANAENADYIKKMICAYSRVPVFTMSDYNVMQEASLCGGFYNSAGDIAAEAVDIVNKYYKNKYIPWGGIINIRNGKAYLSYPALLEKHINVDLIPDDAVVYGKPITFFEKYRVRIILGTSFGIIVFILLSGYAWAQRKLRIINNIANSELEHMNHILQVVLETSDVFPWALDLVKNELHVFGKTYDIEDIHKFIHPDDINTYYENVGYLLEDYSRQTLKENMLRLKIHDSDFFWYKMHGIVDKRDSAGKPTYIIGSAENIDKQKQIERFLVETKEKAIESNNLKTAFLANMSHEIRTPLNAIVGYADLLVSSDDLSNEDMVFFNQNIQTNKELLMQLFNDILDLSKIEAGVLDFNCDMVNMSDVINNAVAAAKFNMNDKEDVVKLVIDDIPESFIICTDAIRVQQVIVNFLNNAIKFTKEGFINIGYKTEKDSLYCYVKDTGIGIDESKQSLVFERFEKLDSFKPGTGLGLAISKMIIEKLNGSIGVESKLGEGSTFWFTLPSASKKFRNKN
jgi:signal transduction histidine kinase